ncbi:MAG: DUF1016 domain-containing protein [Bacteroides sp.]|nr:DUF1016 domain-containing protein [Bacteroides sp.]MBD5363043.1 DUF1016 domain-containing protein [Bacteroides sp.]
MIENAMKLIDDVKNIIEQSRSSAIRSVDFCRVQMYWQIGRRIVEEEQGGEARAEYGAYILKNLSMSLKPQYGSGFGVRQLERARQFYIEYPIASALRSQFNWMQYRLLIAIPDRDKREYYELEAARNNWTAREMERQIHSQLYERLLLSSDREAVLSVARGERMPQKPEEIIKDPMVLEFLGLKQKAHYYENDLESALIDHLQEFLLELGNGFTFVARQKRLLIEDDEFFADLVFYNRLMRCFVVIELKTGKATHQDLGQLQMYVNYYDRYVKTPEENQTIGILLCAEKNDTLVRMSLPENNKTILASKYMTYLPTAEQFIEEIQKVRDEMEESRS